jgi:hypothetical protein
MTKILKYTIIELVEKSFVNCKSMAVVEHSIQILILLDVEIVFFSRKNLKQL